MPRFTRRTELPVPREEAYAWHARPGALQRLLPPWQRVEVVSSDNLHQGSITELRLGPRFLPLRWIAEHRDVEPGKQFTDVQAAGPFSHWEHVHRILPHDIDSRRSTLEDSIDYELPLGPLADAVAGRRLQHEIARMFDYRHRVTRTDLSRHVMSSGSAMTVAVTGSSGVIGSQFCALLTGGGHRVVRFVRSRREVVEQSRGELEGAAYWNPSEGFVDPGAFQGVDAVVHLAGEPIINGRWTRKQRARILDSRARGTRVLADAIAASSDRPSVLLSASGTGIYADNAHEPLDERAPLGDSFLAEVARAWEAATEPASDAGVRVCHLRFGAVLTPRGGPLGLLKPVFNFGLGGTAGRGRDWVPWVAIDDALYAMLHLLLQDELRGPVNIAAPLPVSQRHLVEVLGEHLGRPTMLRYPEALLRVAGGRLAAATALSSARVIPERLANSGFEFAYPTIERALAHVLGRHVTESVEQEES